MLVDVLDVPERDFRRGSAGTYNLLQPEIATASASAKPRISQVSIRTSSPPAIWAGLQQIGCFAQAPIVHGRIVGLGDRGADAAGHERQAFARTGGAHCARGAGRSDECTRGRRSKSHRHLVNNVTSQGTKRGFHDSANLEAFSRRSPAALGPTASIAPKKRSGVTAKTPCRAAIAARRRRLSGSTAQVQADRAGGQHAKVALYPISTGNNIGLGSRSASRFPGQVVVDLGRKMNRILDIDEQLAFAVVEPGVSTRRL